MNRRVVSVALGALALAAFSSTAMAGTCEMLQGKRLFASILSTPPLGASKAVYLGNYYFDFGPKIVDGAVGHDGNLHFTTFYNDGAANKLNDSTPGGTFVIGKCATSKTDPLRAEIYAQAVREPAPGNGYMSIVAAPDGKSFRLRVENSTFAINEVNLTVLPPPAEVAFDASGKPLGGQ